MSEAARLRSPWGFRRRRLADLGTWPFRVGICATLAVITGVASLEIREALSPPDWLVIGLVVLAVTPWLVDLMVAIPPPWVFAPAVIVPVAILHDPTRFDPLPFLLAILALDMGLQAGLLRSAPFVLAGASIVVWQVASVPDGPARSLSGLVGAITAGWLIGLALHSQVRRVARARQQQQAVVEQAAAAERARRETDEVLRQRLAAVRADLAAVRAQLERGEEAGLRERLETAQRRAERLLEDLDGRVDAVRQIPPEATGSERR